MQKLSIVAAVYNEEASIGPFFTALKQVLEAAAWDYEILFVDDGSTDGSLAALKVIAQQDPRVKLISFSRNFGHEAAMAAGIDYATGDGVICMDADLQHPPQSIPEILEKLEAGYEVVNMVRTENPDANLFRRFSSWLFYRLLNLLSPVRFQPNASDFFAISRRVAQVVRQDYRERIRYLRGYIQTLGFPSATVSYKAAKRFAGKSKYSFFKRMSMCFNVLCSFSDLPLKLGIYSGCGVGLLGLIIMLYSIIVKLVWGAPSGYTTIVVALCFLFAVTLFVIGIIGQYIAVLFAEVKGRPVYVVRQTVNLADKEPGAV